VNAHTAFDQDLSHVVAEITHAAAFSQDPPEVDALLGDGSERRFFRVRSSARHAVVLISPRRKHDGNDENDAYWAIGNHLYQSHIPVPRIYWADVARGYFLLEDLGDFHLQAYARRWRRNLFPVYRRVVRLLVELHRRASSGFDPAYCFDSVAYDPAFVYSRELEYFRERFLNGYLGLETGPDDLRRDFENIAEAAGDASRSHVIHRDYQSRNIMIQAQALRLIDFQGMRFGPPAYDLASVLIDPYVGISRALESEAVALYWSEARAFLGCSLRDFMETYRVVRLSRNLQILGAYGYLGIVKGKQHFLGYIPKAWTQLHCWLNSPVGGRFPALQKLVNRLQRAQLPALTGAVGEKVFRDKYRTKG
jgi:N-acetylmuramate 1-kinase